MTKLTTKLQILALLLAATGWLQFGRAFLALFDPLVIDYSEMIVSGATEQLLRSYQLADIYAPPNAPYNMPGVQYPPLFILLTSLLTFLSGLDAILVNRLTAWGLYGLSAGVVGLIVWHETRQKWLAIAATGWPFCFWSVIIFVHAARVDPLALFFSLLAALIYRKYPHKLALISLLAACAFFSKQTYLAISAALLFELWLRHSLRKAFLFAVYMVGWLSAGLLGFGFLSNGAYFGIFEPARAGSFIFELAPSFVGIFVLDHLPLLILAGFGLWQASHMGFWQLYALFAALACLSIVKDGAVDYYFNELAYVLSTIIGISLLSKQTNWKLALLGIQLVVALGMAVAWNHHKDFEAAHPAYQAALTMIKEAQGETLILVDSLLLETKQADKIGDYFVYSVLLRNRQRDKQPLQSDLENGRYTLIITEIFNRWPPEIEAAFAKSYLKTVLRTTDGREIYWVFTKRTLELNR